MNFSFETLEFERLLALVAARCHTPMGADRILSLRPLARAEDLRAELALVSEAIALRDERQVSWSFSGLSDPADTVAVLRIRGASLEPLRALELAAVLRQALEARVSIASEKDVAPSLNLVAETISSSLSDVISKVTSKILPGGELDDSASPELGRIRREINLQRSRLQKTLDAAMRSAGDAIQDPIVTLRNDRYVIPVKTDFRGAVSGVAHGFSSSGATVFVEPLAVIEANNELQNLKGKEEREVAQILLLLTEQLRERLPEIEAAVETVAKLDSVKAKLEFAAAFGACVPVISDDERLELVAARHPLLEQNLKASGSEIVPVTLSLIRERPVMVISGANAGGKTVVMKTAGLLAMMALSGLPVPASSAVIPFYRAVLADIGDHQSLSANLSTFSSHVSNIASMMRDCPHPALVLLDEVGTGTDPDEGSALGVAIVDHFRKALGAQVIASTHYGGLKQYAANDESVVNASVEFNEKTLEPTYRLLMGLAGTSSGIEMARRFGIADEVVAEARLNLSEGARSANEYLARLQAETRAASELRQALEEEREATAERFATLESEAQARESERKREFERELAKVLSDFDKQSKAFIDGIEDKALKSRLEKERAARKSELNRAILERTGKPTAVAGSAAQEATPEEGAVEVGSNVLTKLGQRGVVKKIDRDVAEVMVGQLRLREKVSNLTRIAAPTAPSKKTASPVASPTVLKGVGDSIAELNLIGRTTAEAEDELDKFLDEAYLDSLPRIRIIHGHGTGALKNFVHHFLRSHPHIKGFAFAPQDQGGSGATIADLKL
jgi:DNA mismatch repair protein MutS2